MEVHVPRDHIPYQLSPSKKKNVSFEYVKLIKPFPLQSTWSTFWVVLYALFLCIFQTVSFNSDMTEVSITAQSLAEVEKIVREVSYVNARTYPTPGRRALRVETGVV